MSAHAAGGLYVAQVSSGTSYVAWTGMPLETSRWRVVAIRHGRASAPTLLGAGDQLVGLFSGRSRHVAAVWTFANGRGFPIRYAWLDSRGRLGRKITIATMRGPSSGLQVAVNDRGQLAAAWVQGQQHPTGLLVLCQANGRCASPVHLTIPNTSADAGEFDAVTLGDDGTATALITASAPGNMVSFGLWGIVTHVGRQDGRFSMIAPSGYFPVATASGRGGAVAMFSPTADTLAWTFMGAASGTFSQPTPVPDDMTERSPLLAANLHGEFVAAWSHFTRFDNPTYELRATTGVGDRVGATTTLAGGNQDVPEAPSSVGIDGHGNAIITWEQFSTHGAIGLFDATHAQ